MVWGIEMGEKGVGIERMGSEVLRRKMGREGD